MHVQELRCLFFVLISIVMILHPCHSQTVIFNFQPFGQFLTHESSNAYSGLETDFEVTMNQAKKFIFAKRFEGMPKVDDFEE